MRWTFPALVVAPGLARRAARDYAAAAGADARTLEAIALCVSEAVSNAVVHGYRNGDGMGAVELEASRPNGHLCLSVRDQGGGFAPRVDSPGLGLGLPLITRYVSAFEVRKPASGGTELVMRFELGSTTAA